MELGPNHNHESVNIHDGKMMEAVTKMCPDLISVTFVESSNPTDPITAEDVQMMLKDKLPKVI